MIFKTFSLWSQIYLYLTKLNNLNSFSKSLIFIDIDNTLITPNTDLGSDHFFDWQIDLIQKKDSKALANNIPNMLNILFELWNHIDYRLCDNEVNQVFKNLMLEGKSDLVLCTARSIKTQNITLKSLEQFNIPQYLSTTLVDNTLNNQNTLSLKIKDGIIYCNGKDKGQIIESFIKNINKSYNYIILIDDKLSNLDKFIKHNNRSNIIAIHYTGMDNIVNQFKQGSKDIVLTEYNQFIKNKNKNKNNNTCKF